MKIDVNDPDMVARTKLEEEKRFSQESRSSGTDGTPALTNGYNTPEKPEVKVERIKQDAVDGSTEAETNAEEPVMPPPTETTKSLEFKLTLLEMYNQRVRKRHEAKALMFDRGLLEYKKVRLVG